MEEEHANNTMTRPVELEKVDEGVLSGTILRYRASKEAA
jgi:hypothetical protein